MRAYYFDGKTARRHEAVLSFADGVLLVEADGVSRRESLAQLNISERLGSAPRLLTLMDGAHCEVADSAELDTALRAAGHRSGTVETLQNSGRAALLALLLSVVVVSAAYRWGLPVAAKVIAYRMPQVLSSHLSQSTLAALDKSWLKPTALDEPRRTALSQGYEKLRGRCETCRLEFRASPALGANAFALPDGTLVLLDGLVGLTKNDDEIYAVLAHEQGHVSGRHGLRMVLQGSVVALAMTTWIGDVSTLLAVLPTALLQARYSREFEAEADQSAIGLMRLNGIAPSHLADLLERLAVARGEPLSAAAAQARDSKTGAAHAQSPEDTTSNTFGGYLSSHPATTERIARLRAADSASQAAP